MAINDLPPELRATIQAQSRRPLLHHLNADTSWLVQLPVPPGTDVKRAYFNILLDPWLSGIQSDVASWFSRQWHATEPAFNCISAVEELCQKVENEAALSSNVGEGSSSSLIDAVAISHEFTDHCHKQTLLQLSRSVPIFAAAEATRLIRKWDHFETVIELPNLTSKTKSWQELQLPSLPTWLRMARLQNEKDGLYYHSAIAVVFDLAASGQIDSQAGLTSGSSPECVVYTPHGVHPPTLEPLTKILPVPRTLALLHGLHDIWLDWRQQLNLGAHNGLQAQRVLQAKYWIGTHDEVKHGRGVVSWFLRRKQITIAEAIEEENKKGATDEKLKPVTYHEMDNGGWLVL